MAGYAFETSRMLLTTSDMSMTGAILDFQKRNRDHFLKWEDTKDPDYYTKDYQRYIIRTEKKELREGSGIVFYMLEKTSGLIIGRISVFGMMGGNCSFCMLGYKLDEKYQHQGYMTEALAGVLDVLFEDLRMHRVEVYILPVNAPSLALVRRLGFSEEGIAKGFMRIGGRWLDHVRFAMLRDDWKTLREGTGHEE